MRINHVSFSQCLIQFGNLLLTLFSLNSSAVFFRLSFLWTIQQSSFDSFLWTVQQSSFDSFLWTIQHSSFDSFLWSVQQSSFDSFLWTTQQSSFDSLFFFFFFNNSTVFFWLSFLRKVPQSSNSFDCPFVEIFYNRLFTLLSLNISEIFSNIATRSQEIWSS